MMAGDGRSRSRPAAGYMVYVFIDPRDMLPFYVGSTCRPSARWSAHNHPRGTAASERIAELRDIGIKLRVRIVATGLALWDAQAREIEQIALHSASLVNKLRYLRRASEAAA